MQGPKTEEQLLIVVNQSAHEEHLSQQPPTHNQQLILAVSFLIANNGTFNVTNKKVKIFIAKSITDKDGFIQITVPPGAY